MFSIVDAWFLRPLHFKDADQLVIVLRNDLKHPDSTPFFDFYRDFADWRGHVDAFQNMGGMFWRDFTLTGTGEAAHFHGMIVTPGLFDTLGSSAQFGRVFTDADLHGSPVIVISHQFWVRRFRGARDVLGRSLTLNGKPYQVIGVMPQSFSLRLENQPFDPDVLALIQPGEPSYTGTAMGPLAVIARLKPGVSMQAAQAELATLQTAIDGKYPDAPKFVGVFLTSLKEDNMRFVSTSLRALAGAVLFVLLIACANVAGLLLGRASTRRRELAVRAALGSGRGRLVAQLLTESLLVAAIGGGLGLLVAYAAVRGFVAMNPFALLPPDPITINGPSLAFALALVVITTVLFGTAPAMRASRVDLGEFLKSRGAGGSLRMRSGRAALVIAQIALSLVLLVGSVLMAKTLLQLAAQPLGFRAENVGVAELTLPGRVYGSNAERLSQFYERLLSRIAAIPGVHSGTIANVRPLTGGPRVSIELEGQLDPQKVGMPGFHEIIVTPDYFGTLSIPLLSGRGLTNSDTADSPHVVVVSEMVAHTLFKGADPIGRRIRTRKDGPWLTIVGVAGTTRTIFYNTLNAELSPDVFVPAKQAVRPIFNPVSQSVWLFVRGQLPLTRATVRQQVDAVDRDIPVGEVMPLGEMVSEATSQPRMRTALLTGFAVLALVLAAIGIYGLIAQSTAQRAGEIGIRMALGARSGDVLRMVISQTLSIAVAGIVLGVVGGIALGRMLSPLLYGIPATDPVAYAIVEAAVIGAALLAAYVPARRASRVDPTVVLRYE